MKSNRATNKKILFTGTAGFIGFHLANQLLNEGYAVTGLDNINDYYDPNLKFDRLEQAGIARADAKQWGRYAESSANSSYRFIRMNLEDKDGVAGVFEDGGFDYVIHLAAQAGVRYSLENPHAVFGAG